MELIETCFLTSVDIYHKCCTGWEYRAFHHWWWFRK